MNVIALMFTLASLGQSSSIPPSVQPKSATQTYPGFATWYWTQNTQDGKSAGQPFWRWGVLGTDGRVHEVFPPTQAKPKGPPTAPELNYGLSLDKMNEPAGKTGRYYASGPTAQQFVDAAQNATFKDDSRKLHLSVIGTQEEQDAAKTTLASGPLNDLAKDFHVQYYTPDNWAVTGIGLPATGHPSIHIQLPGGDHVWAATSNPGEAGMVAGINYAKSKLRKPDPDYDPNKVPGPDKPPPKPPGPLVDPVITKTWLDLIIACGGVFGLAKLILPKRGQA